jgi:hypothetical protein
LIPFSEVMGALLWFFNGVYFEKNGKQNTSRMQQRSSLPSALNFRHLKIRRRQTEHRQPPPRYEKQAQDLGYPHTAVENKWVKAARAAFEKCVDFKQVARLVYVSAAHSACASSWWRRWGFALARGYDIINSKDHAGCLRR